MKKILLVDNAATTRTARHHARAQRRRHQTPFGGRIGMRDAAAEGAARADRIVGDVVHHRRQQKAQRPVDQRPFKCAVPHAGADDEFATRW